MDREAWPTAIQGVSKSRTRLSDWTELNRFWKQACPLWFPLNQWCHPNISSSVALFSFCPQSFPESGSFLVSRLFASSSQSIGASASASASVLPKSIQGWFHFRLTDLISLGLSRVFSSTTVRNHQFFGSLPSLSSGSHIHNGKTIALTIWTFVSKVMSLLFNTLSRFVIAFLPRSKRLLISSRARIWSLVYLTPNPILGIKTLSLPEASLVAQRKEYACQFKPWVGKICWRRKCQPTPVFLAGKSHGQRILVHCNPWGHKESDTT